ncbi:pVII protein [Barthadenovirus sternae]|nr:pVII [Tern adenovirus]UJZ92509.1 pVII protein [Tern atadenovirus 1]
MSILISPSDNTGWGVGTHMMRATGLKFSRTEPVRVRTYYRAQWGQLNGRKTRSELKRGYRHYKKKYIRYIKNRRKAKLTSASRHSASTNMRRIVLEAERRQAIRDRKKMREAAALVEQEVSNNPSDSTVVVEVEQPRKSRRKTRKPTRLNL